MERQLFPEEKFETEEEVDLWRGERRNFYRLNVQKLGLKVTLDLGTNRGICLEHIPVFNLSPAGCCALVPLKAELQPGNRIPRLTFPFEEEELTIRAKVVHTAIFNSQEELENNCI